MVSEFFYYLFCLVIDNILVCSIYTSNGFVFLSRKPDRIGSDRVGKDQFPFECAVLAFRRRISRNCTWESWDIRIRFLYF